MGVDIGGGRWKYRCQRTYKAKSIEDALKMFNIDKTRHMIGFPIWRTTVPKNAEIIKVWQLVEYK